MKIISNTKALYLLVCLLFLTYSAFAKQGVRSISVPLTGNTDVYNGTKLISGAFQNGAKFAVYPDIMDAYSAIGPTDQYWPGPGSNVAAMTSKIDNFDIVKSKATIKLRILEAKPGLCLPDNFTFTVNISYKKFSTALAFESTTPVTKQLSVTYKKGQGLKYKNLDILQIDEALFLSCRVESIVNLPSNIDLRPFVELYAELEYDYLLKESFFSTTRPTINADDGVLDKDLYLFTPSIYLSFDNLNKDNILIKPLVKDEYTEFFKTGTGEIGDFWITNNGYNQFVNWIDSVEIQWTFSESEVFELNTLGEFKKNGIPTHSIEFNNNVISVTLPYPLKDNIYKLANIFEDGIIAFRARFIGRLAIKDINNNIIGLKTIKCPWSDRTVNSAPIIFKIIDPGITPTLVSIPNVPAINVGTFSPKLNWIYNCTYAEDGKKKEVINYFDGTLKSRQTITTSNTDNFALIKETIYDFQGRPAIEVLPVPTLPNSLKYVPNFNLSSINTPYSAANFDYNTSDCGTVTAGMLNTSGAAKYYSNQNNWLTSTEISNKTQYIPNSGSGTNNYYPFVQTVYSPDNTGRVSYTTQPGEIFALNSGRETQYLYGRPEQEELDRLFGSEIGFAEHYTKDAVKDANGQYSISIKDLSGKVIVTALAGKKESDANTKELNSANQTQDIEVDLLKHSQADIEDGLLLTSPLIVLKNQNFDFSYSLNPANYSKYCETGGALLYCLDCVYDLEISITDECGREYLQGDLITPTVPTPIKRRIGPTILDGTLATSGAGYNITNEALIQKINGKIRINLPEGKYFINRKITINNDAREEYLNKVVATQQCKTLLDFENEEKAKIDLGQCRPCDAYRDAKKKGGNIKENYKTDVYLYRFKIAYNSSAPTPTELARMNTIIDEFEEAKKRCDVNVEPCLAYKKVLMTDMRPGKDLTPTEASMPGASVIPRGIYANTDINNAVQYTVFKQPTATTTPWYKDLAFFTNTLSPLDGTTPLKDMPLPDLLGIWNDSYTEQLIVLHPEYYHLKACEDLEESKKYDFSFNATLNYAEAKQLGYLGDVGTGTNDNKDPLAINLINPSLATEFIDVVNNHAWYGLGLTNSKTATTFIGTIGTNNTIPLSSNSSLKSIVAYFVFCKDAATNDKANCTANALSNLDNCDYRAQNLFWTYYKGMYQAVKTRAYETQLATYRGNTTLDLPPSDFNGGSFKYNSTFTKLITGKARFTNLPDPNTATEGVIKLKNQKDKVNDNCRKNCENMADGWIAKLTNCSFGETESERKSKISALKTALINVCKEGCDINSPFGASTVKPSSTNIDKSFEDVFLRLGFEYKPECNAGLITFPKPYGTTGTLSDNKNNPLADLQTDLCGIGINPCILFGNCNTSTIVSEGSNSCSILDVNNNTDLKMMINLFDTMTCEYGNCISCAKFRDVNQEYISKSNEYRAATSFTDFANEKLKFNLTATEYTSFKAKCLGFNSVSEAEASLGLSIEEAYKNGYLITSQLDVTNNVLNPLSGNSNGNIIYNQSESGNYDNKKEIFNTTPCQLLSELFYSLNTVGKDLKTDAGKNAVAIQLLDLINNNKPNRDGTNPSVLLSLFAKMGKTSNADILAQIKTMLCECEILKYCECVITPDPICVECESLSSNITYVLNGLSVPNGIQITSIYDLFQLKSDPLNQSKIITFFNNLNKTNLNPPTLTGSNDADILLIINWLTDLLKKCNHPEFSQPVASFDCNSFNLFINARATKDSKNIFKDHSASSLTGMVDLYNDILGSKFALSLKIPNFNVSGNNLASYTKIKNWLLEQMEKCSNSQNLPENLCSISSSTISNLLNNTSEEGKQALILFYFEHNSGYEELVTGVSDVYNEKYTYSGSTANYSNYKDALLAQLSLCNYCTNFSNTTQAYAVANSITLNNNIFNTDFSIADQNNLKNLINSVSNTPYFINYAKLKGLTYDANNYWLLKKIFRTIYCDCRTCYDNTGICFIDNCSTFSNYLNYFINSFPVAKTKADLMNDESVAGKTNLITFYANYLLYTEQKFVLDLNLDYYDVKNKVMDLMCSCGVDSAYCPNELIKCSYSNTQNTTCFIANNKLVALQNLLQKCINQQQKLYYNTNINLSANTSNLLFSNANTNGSIKVEAQFNFNGNINGNVTDRNKYGCGYDFSKGYNYSRNGNGGYRITLSNSGFSTGVLNFKITSNNITGLTKSFTFINVSEDNKVFFSGYGEFAKITKILDIMPVYLPGSVGETKYFVVKVVVNTPEKGDKVVLINGYFEDELTRSVDCSVKCTKLCKKPQVKINTCEEELNSQAIKIAQYKYDIYIANLINQERINYTEKCLNSLKTNELFTKTYTDNQYHYTLYYYDAAGNLMKTVPPQGVKPLDPSSIKAIHTQRLVDMNNYKNYPNNQTALATIATTNHYLVTQYNYNTLNQLTWQNTPDAGTSKFFYDQVGRLVLSQNAKQFANSSAESNKFSYTIFDKIGRINEVGELLLSSSALQKINTDVFEVEKINFIQDNIVNNSQRSEITRTHYDYNPNLLSSSYSLNNLRSRVAQVSFFYSLPSNASIKPDQAIMYSYDVTGNVTQIIRYVKGLEILGQEYKTVDYDFDVISGKVENVYYQNKGVDQYIHHYKYDAENRLVESYSSPRNELIDKTADGSLNKMGLDAAYNYYYHGPLSRTVIGELQVQGLDYAYTLQGWLKGVNSYNLNAAYDMGKDGYYEYNSSTQVTTKFANTDVAKDEMGFVLNYHDLDYSQIQQNTSALAYTNKFNGNILSSNSGFAGYAKQLYNGNIGSMITAIGQFINSSNSAGLVSAYNYDQLNRIAEAKYFTEGSNGIVATTNNWNNKFTYDANGNILTQFRNGNEAMLSMDNMTYYYKGYNAAGNLVEFTYNNAGAMVDRSNNIINNPASPSSADITKFTNQLSSVKDPIGVGNYSDDIDEQSVENYKYDEIGNLTQDNAEQIASIEWNLYGKIRKINRIATSSKPNLEFEYTPDGHRAVKIVIPKNTNMPKIYTYYVRDAQGNIMATYEREFLKTVNFEALSYNDVNTKLITKSGLNGFASFIANQHQNTNVIKNALETSMNATPSKTNEFLSNNDLPALVITSGTTTMNNIISSYDDWTFFNTISYQIAASNIEALANNMDQRNSRVGSFLTLQSTIVQNQALFADFITGLSARNNGVYINLLDALGIPKSSIESEINALNDYITAYGDEVVISKLNDLIGFGRINTGDVTYQILDDLINNNPTFLSNLLASIPEFKELFYQINSTYNCGQLDANSIINALNTANSPILLTKTQTYYLGGTAAMINWYKFNQPYSFVYYATLIDAAAVTTTQQSNLSLYTTAPNSNGINLYFNQIRAYFGQSIADQILNEFLPNSNLYVDKLMLNEWHIYGSSRLGIYKAEVLVASKTLTQSDAQSATGGPPIYSAVEQNPPVLDYASYSQIRGAKNYELSNHLGNVLVVVTDKKTYNCGNTELINANFDNGSYNNIFPITSNTSMSLSGNKLNVSGTNTQVGTLFNIEGEASRIFKVDFDLTIGSGISQVWFETNASYNSTGGGLSQNVTNSSSSGHVSFTFTAPQGAYRFKIGGTGTGTYSIDNLIVKEVGPGRYQAEIVTANDYSPFGAPMPGRSFKADNVLVKTTLSTSNFATGTDGWVATTNATLSNVFGNIRATVTAVNAGMKKTFSTEPGKTYRVMFKINLRGWPYMYIKDKYTNTNLLSITNYIVPGDASYTFTATGFETDVIFNEATNPSGSTQLASFTLEEVEANSGYRFSFNGQEKDDEVSGAGNTMTAEFWEYDARLGRRWNLDPVVNVSISGYVTFNNCPIALSDHNGLEPTKDDPPKKKEKRRSAIGQFRYNLGQFVAALWSQGPWSRNHMVFSWEKRPPKEVKEVEAPKEKFDVLEVVYTYSREVETFTTRSYNYDRPSYNWDIKVDVPNNPIPLDIQKSSTLKIITNSDVILTNKGIFHNNVGSILFNALIFIDNASYLQSKQNYGYSGQGDVGSTLSFGYQYTAMSIKVIVKVPKGTFGIRNWSKAKMDETLTEKHLTKKGVYYRQWQ